MVSVDLDIDLAGDRAVGRMSFPSLFFKAMADTSWKPQLILCFLGREE